MPEGRCHCCKRLIFDTEKVEELKRDIECQHCHYLNLVVDGEVVCRGAVSGPVEPEPYVRAKPKPKAAPKRRRG